MPLLRGIGCKTVPGALSNEPEPTTRGFGLCRCPETSHRSGGQDLNLRPLDEIDRYGRAWTIMDLFGFRREDRTVTYVSVVR